MSLRMTKGGSPGAQAANVAELFYYNGITPVGLAVINENGAIVRLDRGLIAVRVHTSTDGGTYTPSTGTHAMYVECVGPGGGGGGADQAATNAAAGGGGGGGAYAAKWITTVVAAYDVSVPNGGAGGIGPQAGATPNDTTFAPAGGAVVVSGDSGGGGSYDLVTTIHTGGAGGNAGVAAACVGDLKVSGFPGGCGLALAAAQCVGGYGGAAGMGFGGGAVGVVDATAVGNAGGVYDSGGSGATIVSGGVDQTGGAGAPGVIRVWEYA